MPFTPLRIKVSLLEATGLPTLSAIADGWNVRFEELSACIRQVKYRVYPHLRILIAEVIGHPVEEVFGEHPLTTALLQQKQKNQRAA